MVKIFIDPGHGGDDPGAIGNGLREKDLVLDISRRIRRQLNRFNDVEVRMSREDDRFISLSNRATLANSWGADYFISVHVNAAGGTGFESYIWNGNVKSQTRSNQSIMHSEIIAQIGVRDRGRKSANFAVLRRTNMPAILTENLFIDNAAEAAKLKDSDFLEAIAKGHTNGLVSIYNLKGNGTESGTDETNGSDEEGSPPSGEISQIQSTLNDRYALSIAVDNIYGPETQGTLLKGLQTELNKQFNRRLVVDGIWGPNTRGAVVNVRRGARGNITWVLQATLLGKGFSPGSIDGIFGPKTESAVRRFQRAQGIKIDGIAGQETFTALFS
ncbi:N-acetylmuramoyl-L-alanine amidase [Salipaludibacillus sp. HK11]|uniref:N-acetylmuramoyl-L-alanine amidase n=1 Tax=Salipaludibacillus sp. HK11 TaxID=3394320 RepID=UPI0039FC2CD4